MNFLYKESATAQIKDPNQRDLDPGWKKDRKKERRNGKESKRDKRRGRGSFKMTTAL